MPKVLLDVLSRTSYSSIPKRHAMQFRSDHI